MTAEPVRRRGAALARRLAATHRLAAVLCLGFASGLPLALSGQAMQAWLAVDGVDLATIGFLGLVGIPYTFKFLWAPLMDRFEPPWLGRRRGWLVLSQLGIAAVLVWMSGISPSTQSALFAQAAVLLAFLSASQDIVIDAYRTDVLRERERGLGSSLYVFGYRLAMIVSGGIALIWAQQWHSWPKVYLVMAGIMAGAGALSLLLLPRVNSDAVAPDTAAGRDLAGFAAMLGGVIVGFYAAREVLRLLGLEANGGNRWIDLFVVLSEIGVALPLGWWCARIARFETLNRSLESFFARSGAASFLLLIILYKLGDAFAGSLATPFLIKGLGFTQAEVGIANKIIGIWLTIFGAMLAGVLMFRISLYRALLVFGVLQLVSNLGFWVLAVLGKGAWGGLQLQPFDAGLLAVTEPVLVDYLLLAAIAFENISGGMGTTAFVALLMALCNKRFSATHYALLSALASVGRIYVSPLSGVLAGSIGWPAFFLFSVFMAVPGIVMVWWMRRAIAGLTHA